MRTVGQRLSRAALLFLVISFLGWLTEMVFFRLLYGRFYDRGFLTLPFCTIYGFALFAVYALAGIPARERGLLLRRVEGELGQTLCYFLLAAVIPTAMELATGYFFHHFFGIRLWDYSTYRYHFHGYISLEYSMLWVVTVPLCMRYGFAPLMRGICALPDRCTALLAATLTLCVGLDWSSKLLF